MSKRNGSLHAHPTHAQHAAFLELLPKVERHARIFFRHVRCPATREDRIADTIALAWAWFVRLQERGKDLSLFTMVFIFLVARSVMAGRRVCGKEKAKDVMSPIAQQRHGFRVESLPSTPCTCHEQRYCSPHGQRDQDALEERLQDNTQTPPDQQAMFRIDFAAWLRTLTPRERRLILAMALDERTLDLARMFDLSPGRISQMRSQFRDGWVRFCGE